MPFDATDLYTVSAGINLYNYWNPFVTKFDTSAFYHWEQDNLPLYDLEERTDYLWEKLGYPTSSLPGLALAVSSTIPTHLSVSSNVFTSLQDAIDALPEIIRFPTLIEVAASGDLGSISLDNIKCVGDGALEIVNRVYTDLSGADASYKTVNTSGAGSTVSSVDARTTLNDTSCLLLSAQTSSLFDTNADGVYICSNKHLNNGELQTYLTLGVGNNSTQTASITSTAFEMEAHDVKLATSPAQDTTIDYESISDGGVDVRTSTTYGRNNITAGIENVLGMAAGNYLRGVTISNCDGPIYLRKFVVNAASGTTALADYGTTSDIGIHVSNTEGLRIEDCAAARAKKVGLQVDNSNIEINRKFYSVRNYDQDARGTEDDAGIIANNSNIQFLQEGLLSNVFDSQIVVSQQMRGIRLVNSKLTGGLKSNESLSNGSLVGAISCDTGVELESSIIDVNGVLDTYACQSTGVKAVDSTIKLDSSIFQGNAKAGMDLKNSTCEYNKNRTNITSYPTMGASVPNYLHQQSFSFNGQHLVSDKSKFYHKYGSGTPVNSGSLCFHISSGASKVDSGGTIIRDKPSLQLRGSDVDLVHASILSAPTGSESIRGINVAATDNSTVRLKGSDKNATTAILQNVTDLGINVYADKNSTIECAGSVIVGDAGTAIMADNDSVIKFTPHYRDDSNSLDISGWDLSSSENHTNIEVVGRNNCIVVNNNSTLYMRDLGSFSACHGAINSTLSSDAIDSYKNSAQYTSGGSFTFYPNSSRAMASLTDGPNPATAIRSARAIFGAGSNPLTRVFASTTNNSIDYNRGLELQSASISDYRAFSVGGICVRALNNSVVEAQNVNFLAGPVNADDVFLDPTQNQTGGCNDLRIWAFGGGSRLNASLLSVSSAYPSEPGYTGPRGIYYTDTTFDVSAAAYTAFSGLPYSNGNDAAGSALPLSGLAILDFFGLGASALSGLSAVDSSSGEKYFRGWSKQRFGSDNPFGFGTSADYQNYGPYRLYLEIDPAAKALKYLGSDLTVESVTDNRPYQTLAQGYFLSGDCSAASGTATDVHYSLYRVDPNTSSLESSGYYHVSSFCRPDSYNIMLDETGANTFANAKNASIEILGRPKLVNIYTPTTRVDGEANICDTSGFGTGFISTNIFDPDRQY